jgi:hypothetical protein
MASAAESSLSERQGAAGLPARRLEGRRVVVVLGASTGGLSLLARTLQVLGVDMIEHESGQAAPDPHAWRRPWIGEFHARLLETIGRPEEHPAHALPFPPGWWRRPAVQAIRREMSRALEAALEDHSEGWGFADVATARLLPVWAEVFDRAGVQPVYLWALTPPAKADNGGRGRGATAEIRWFAYSADVYRYAGERLTAVIEESAWRDDPQALLDKLLGRLQLSWRGTRLDLFESLRDLLQEAGEADDEAATRAPSLPITAVFYREAARSDEDADARSRLDSLVESAELLRPMITPLLPQLNGKLTPARPAAGQAERELIALREEVTDLRRRLNGAATAPEPVPDDDRIGALEAELDARAAETRWLHEQYRERLSEAEAEAAALRARLSGLDATPVTAVSHVTEEELAAAQAEIQQLKAEMRNLSNANERYLARIYELKKALEERGGY